MTHLGSCVREPESVLLATEPRKVMKIQRFALLAALPFALLSCEKQAADAEKKMDEAGEKMEAAASDAKDAMKDAAAATPPSPPAILHLL